MQLDYELERKNKKTVSVKILADGRVLVSAPKHLPKSAIADMLNKHQKWIEKKQAEYAKLRQEQGSFDFSAGQRLLYLGEYYPCAEVCDREAAFGQAGKWYREQAQTIVPPRVSFWAKQMDVAYAKVKINSARSRWGSCSAKGNVNFSWRILFLPPELVDYIIVHELCHLKQLNHSTTFWREVADILPDYRTRQAALKEYQKKIRVYEAIT